MKNIAVGRTQNERQSKEEALRRLDHEIYETCLVWIPMKDRDGTINVPQNLETKSAFAV